MKCYFFFNALLSVVFIPGLVFAGSAEAQDPKRIQGNNLQDQNTPAEYAVTEGRFNDDAASVEKQLDQLMAEIRRKKSAQIKGISPDDIAKAIKRSMLRSAEEIDAKLHKNGLWNTDGGRQAMGMSSYLRGDQDAAIEGFTKALALAKTPNVRTWILEDRGAAYFAKGDKVNALKDLEAAISIKAEDKSSNLALLAWRLGRIADAKRELELAAAYQRTKTAGFVAEWGTCTNLKAIGEPAAGCITSAITDCFSLYGTGAFAKSDCGQYEPEMKYLQARRTQTAAAAGNEN